MKNFLNKEELVVPTADTTDNAYAMDVLGNKTDAAAAGAVSATESLMAYAKQNVTNTEALGTSAPKLATTASIALPQTGTTNLFTVSGMVNIIQIVGVIDIAIGAVANNTKLVAGGGSVDICAVVDLNAAAQFSTLSITGTFANAMIINAGGAFEVQAGKVSASTGNVVVDCAGSDGGGGRVTWAVVWEPVTSGATLVAA